MGLNIEERLIKEILALTTDIMNRHDFEEGKTTMV